MYLQTTNNHNSEKASNYVGLNFIILLNGGAPKQGCTINFSKTVIEQTVKRNQT